MEDLNKIKARIARLLAMAADSSSPHEAAIAARRARSMMDKYQIDMMQMSEHKAEEMEARASGQAYKYMPLWISTLSVRVAEYNDCQAVKDHSGRVVFQGYISDTRLADDMLQSLIKAITHQCRLYMVENGYAGSYNAKIGTAFKDGCSSAIRGRLCAMTVEREALTGTVGGNQVALVEVKKDAVSDHFGGVSYGSTKKKVSEEYEARRAIASGILKGQQMEIVKGIV